MSTRAFLPSDIPGLATFRPAGDGLVFAELSSAAARAELALHGAHLMRWQPAGAKEVLFMSAASHFAPRKPIRGGVPICFPWFGPSAGQPAAPAHGFARILPWKLDAVQPTGGGGVRVALSLAADDESRAHWPHEFAARMTFDIGRELGMHLEVENRGAESFAFEEALHTYFAISSIHDVSVTGLEGAAYLDKTDGLRRKQLGPEPLRFSAETDRVFPGTTATCVIHDPGFGREIVVEKSGSQSTVVWNPWIAKAAAMPDFGDAEWPGMLCIETANVGDDAVTLAPGARHTMTATIRLR